jgi:ribosomal protein S27AE
MSIRLSDESIQDGYQVPKAGVEERIMFCSKCGNEVNLADEFCSNCGARQSQRGQSQGHRGQGGRNRVHRNQGDQGEQSWRGGQGGGNGGQNRVPAIKTEAGAKAFNAIKDEKRAAADKTKRITLWTLAISFLLAAVFFGLSKSAGMNTGAYTVIFSAVFLTALISFFYIGEDSWTEKEYYSIPGSRNSAEKHVCIHCGNLGIHRRTIYGTNYQVSECSKCDATLWVY